MRLELAHKENMSVKNLEVYIKSGFSPLRANRMNDLSFEKRARLW